MERNQRETLADYVSEEGEKIKVVTGQITRTGTTINETGRRFKRYYTEIYVDGIVQHIYDESEIREDNIPALRYIISECVKYKSVCDELVLSIDEKIEEIRSSEDNELEDIGGDSRSLSKILEEEES